MSKTCSKSEPRTAMPQMPPATNPPASSVRDLARLLGISHTTVSQALRDSPKVRAETRRRVHEAAKAAGYQCSPLAGALMTGMRRKRGAAFHDTVAIVDIDGPENRPPDSAAYHLELIEGASERAAELGFKPQLIRRGHPAINDARIPSWLASNGIHAALLLPVKNHAALDWREWSRHAAVYADYCEGASALHSICPDHFAAMRLTLDRLRAQGCRRPGLVLDQSEDERLCHRWSNAFAFLQSMHPAPAAAPVPILKAPGITQPAFARWFKTHNPDVVIGHHAELIDWMRATGAKVPETHGFCSLNIIKNPDIACAGIDQNARLIGARGMEQLIGQIYRDEYGLPAHPSNTTIPPAWIDGPTLPQPVSY